MIVNVIEVFLRLTFLYLLRRNVMYLKMYNPMTTNKWSGLGDGWLNAKQIVSMMEASDDKYVAATERIRNVDILIIDVISMLSCLLFEKLEYLMRHIRNRKIVFGCTGDISRCFSKASTS